MYGCDRHHQVGIIKLLHAILQYSGTLYHPVVVNLMLLRLSGCALSAMAVEVTRLVSNWRSAPEVLQVLVMEACAQRNEAVVVALLPRLENSSVVQLRGQV